jgi:hypothetical protein
MTRLALFGTKKRLTILWDGDSLSADPPANGAHSYPFYASQRIVRSPRMVDVAVSGSYGGHYALPPSTGPWNTADVYSILTGHNGYNAGATGAQVHTLLTTIVSDMRGFGVRWVFVGTVFASVLLAGSEETERLAGNALILGDLCGADAVIDFAADPFFQDHTNFPDGTHPDDEGRKRQAAIAAAVMNPVLL